MKGLKIDYDKDNFDSFHLADCHSEKALFKCLWSQEFQ